MSNSVFDSHFHEAVLAIYFDFEAGKQSPEFTLNALKAMLKEAETSEHLAHQGKVLEYLGATEYHQNNLEEARQYFEQARRVYTIGQHHHLVGMLDLNVGNIYFSKGWYERCKDYYLKAYSLGERYKYIGLQALALNNYGYLLYMLGEYQQAQKTLEKAYQLGQAPWNDVMEEESGNLVRYRQRNNMNLEENLASVAMAQGRYQTSWEHAQRGLKLAIEHELKIHVAHFSVLLGELLSKMPELDTSKTPDSYYEEASSHYELLNIPVELCQSYLTHAKSCYERGLAEKAQELLADAKKAAIQYGLTKEMVMINDVEVLWRTKA